VIGEINPDIIVWSPRLQPEFGQVEKLVDSIELTVGSSSVIFASALCRLGLRTAFTGVVGDDPLGHYMLQEMNRLGIDTGRCVMTRDTPTGATVILSRGEDRALLTAQGAMRSLRADQVPRELLAISRHIHVGSYYLQPQLADHLPDLLRTARESGLTTSFDCNWDPSGRWNSGFDAVLAASNVCFLNRREAAQITGLDEPEEAAAQLIARARKVRSRMQLRSLKSGEQPPSPRASRPARSIGGAGPTLVVKMGADGAYACDNVNSAQLPAPAVEVVDTTGAGDSFDAGFVLGFLSGWSLEESLRLAVACGSLSTRSIGGTAGQPTLEDAEKFLSSSAGHTASQAMK
jgi:sugar/nucleoside kinase (ribokinase family)